MKKISVLFLLVVLMYSCRNKHQQNQPGSNASTSNDKPESLKKITARDYSITTANAYNDVFLDSMAMEHFISEGRLNDTVTRRMRSFYNARNYQYAWFASDGLTEQARSFWSLQNYYKTKDSSAAGKQLAGIIGRLETAEDLKVSTDDKNILRAELLFTEEFIQYILNNYEAGTVKRKEMERFIPLVKSNSLKTADSLLNKKHKDKKYYEDQNAAYGALKQQLQKYSAIAKAGGWPTIGAGALKLKQGAANAEVLHIKKRLQTTGEMGFDSTNIFNASLDAAVKVYQSSLGMTADGIISETLIKEMNVPVQKRIQQIMINMDRMRWMPEPSGNLMIVNIPEFMLHVYEGKNMAFEMPVVVGKEGHNTVMFKGDMSLVVFSPYWNVPSDIVEKEILPGMRKNPNYLSNHHMEITGNTGGLPVIRQLPGEENSLGKVKFLFPNSFNIYFHDTPAKSLFSKDRRAFSHGCIRLSDPVKMAEYVLRSMPEWDPAAIAAAMNSGVEKTVLLKNPIPVIITYYTAWVNPNGVLNFRDDVYGHDAQLAKKMFID